MCAAEDARTRADLASATRRLAGAAGVVGFTALSQVAREIETALGRDGAQGAPPADMIERLQAAYGHDEEAAPDWAVPDEPETPPPASFTIVLAEDDEMQQLMMTRVLEAAGHVVTAISRGDEVLEAVRRIRPTILLLDQQLPGMDGYTICRHVKADPALTSVAVVFVTSAISPDDRLAGLLLGADDYIEKPVDLADLSLRLTTVATRRAEALAGHQEPKLARGELTYGEFVTRTADLLQQTTGALVLLRTPADVGMRVASWLTGELRRDDLLARYRDDLRILFLPGLIGRTAERHVSDVVSRLDAAGLPVSWGIAVADRPNARTLPALLQEADGRLTAHAALAPAPPAEAREGGPTVTLRRRSVLVADDDEGTRLLAVRPLSRDGLHCRTAADGREALERLAEEVPEVLVLDLSMPNLDGLGVLAALARRPPPRPRVIVVSANRQEDDVRKALALGAEDYVVKPFNPLMLLTRVRRLMH